MMGGIVTSKGKGWKGGGGGEKRKAMHKISVYKCVWLNICLCICLCLYVYVCVSEWVMISIVYYRKGGGQVEKL